MTAIRSNVSLADWLAGPVDEPDPTAIENRASLRSRLMGRLRARGHVVSLGSPPLHR